jgi:hypothetical protein
MIQVENASEMSCNFYRAIRSNIPEDSHVHLRLHKILPVDLFWTTSITIHYHLFNKVSLVKSSNVVFAWLTLLFRIREFPGSNHGPETGYPDLGFSLFSLVPSGKFRDSTLQLGHDSFLQHPLQFITHVSSFHSTLCSLSYWESVFK